MMRQILTNPDMMRDLMTPQNLQAAQSMMSDPNAMQNMSSMGGGASPFMMPGNTSQGQANANPTANPTTNPAANASTNANASQQ